MDSTPEIPPSSLLLDEEPILYMYVDHWDVTDFFDAAPPATFQPLPPIYGRGEFDNMYTQPGSPISYRSHFLGHSLPRVGLVPLPPALQRVSALEMSSPQFPNQLAILLNEEFKSRSHIRNLRDDDARWLIDYIDKVRITPCK